MGPGTNPSSIKEQLHILWKMLLLPPEKVIGCSNFNTMHERASLSNYIVNDIICHGMILL